MTDTEFIDSLTLKTHEDIRSREDIIKELLDRRSSINEEIAALDEKLRNLNLEKASISDEFKRLGYSETLPPLNLGTPTIDIHANPLDKAYFLHDLFQGRRNAYPKRVYSKKSGSIVYSPQCFNFYQKGCPRKEDQVHRLQIQEPVNFNHLHISK